MPLKTHNMKPYNFIFILHNYLFKTLSFRGKNRANAKHFARAYEINGGLQQDNPELKITKVKIK